ncbi:CaiB/BaiF CoA-transferase family protein [uncultured Ruegeria sp.]|uniref:CaiB/BaiF CoA transferase family protein n=1 Tax=uncultured Ruegeria sp. TaxID=259304 RepID=UPI0026110233|nr:CaiB/BaiF CoA-transferase family protein [uncultured Ruegeria sp.]
MIAPLKGITIVDFSQFLAGPYASLKLLDMGARVIKVENPDKGDLCRQIYLSDTQIEDDSTLFHSINRGKESIALDLKTPQGLEAARRLIVRTDIVIQNFRPGVMDRLGLSYSQVQQIKPDIIYGSVSGYGRTGDWADLPGQDLLAQARSGIMWLNGNAEQGPVPVGLPVADINAGANLAQGLLGALFHRARSGEGVLVETSLLESLLDLQFEFLTTYLNNGERPPQRLQQGSAHGYLAAPYGVYETAEGHLALAMTPIETLAKLMELPDLCRDQENPGHLFQRKEEIFTRLQRAFRARSAKAWEQDLGQQGVWCARVLDWPEMLASDSFADMFEQVRTSSGAALRMVRSPIQFGGTRAVDLQRAPQLNEHGITLLKEIGLG